MAARGGAKVRDLRNLKELVAVVCRLPSIIMALVLSILSFSEFLLRRRKNARPVSPEIHFQRVLVSSCRMNPNSSRRSMSALFGSEDEHREEIHVAVAAVVVVVRSYGRTAVRGQRREAPNTTATAGRRRRRRGRLPDAKSYSGRDPGCCFRRRATQGLVSVYSVK